MKYLNLALFSILFLAGCASMPSKVRENISVGDPQKKVFETLGSPDSARPSQQDKGAMVYSWDDKTHHCEVKILEDKVLAYRCKQTHETFMQGMARGINEYQQRQPSQVQVEVAPIHCSTTHIGTMNWTDCNN